MLVFDLGDRQSFHELEQLHFELKRQFTKIGKPLNSILIGTKSDLIKNDNAIRET